MLSTGSHPPWKRRMSVSDEVVERIDATAAIAASPGRGVLEDELALAA